MQSLSAVGTASLGALVLAVRSVLLQEVCNFVDEGSESSVKDFLLEILDWIQSHTACENLNYILA